MWKNHQTLVVTRSVFTAGWPWSVCVCVIRQDRDVAMQLYEAVYPDAVRAGSVTGGAVRPQRRQHSQHGHGRAPATISRRHRVTPESYRRLVRARPPAHCRHPATLSQPAPLRQDLPRRLRKVKLREGCQRMSPIGKEEQKERKGGGSNETEPPNQGPDSQTLP